jgi:hypothetical protein
MPRSRLIVLLWIIGTVLFLGLWANSLARKSIVRYQNPTAEKQSTVGIVAGSVEITWETIYGRGPPRVEGFRYKYESGKLPGPLPDYKFGRFYHQVRDGDFSGTMIEVPLWFLLALYSLLLWPLHRRALKRERTPPLDLSAQSKDLPQSE